jgi:methyl-accepting chemotaxis protein
MRPANFPRRRYLIDTLQYRILMTNLLYVLAVVIVFGGVLFLPLMITLKLDTVGSPDMVNAAREFLSLHNRIWPPVAVLIALLVVHNIVFSHRIVGPLYRIRSDLKRVGEGNLFVHVRLRKNDYLDKEAASINAMIEALRAKIRAIEQNQRKASAVLVELQKALVRGTADEMTEQIDDLGETLEHLRRSVEQFQVPREVSRGSVATPAPVVAKRAVDPVDAEVPQGV